MHANIKFISADEAVKYVQSGDHIHFSSVASAPKVLIDALCRRGDNGELKDVRIHHLHTEGEAPYTDANMKEFSSIRHSLLVATLERAFRLVTQTIFQFS